MTDEIDQHLVNIDNCEGIENDIRFVANGRQDIRNLESYTLMQYYKYMLTMVHIYAEATTTKDKIEAEIMRRLDLEQRMGE